MAQQLLLSIQDAQIIFGKTPLFENLSFNIHVGDKICLIGKNGAGKSTLMNIIAGNCEMDLGKRTELPGIRIGYLTQDLKFDKEQKVYDYLALGLVKNHQEEATNTYMIDAIAHSLDLNTGDKMGNLSGGNLRRAGLARTLVENPDLLLLDEPTNHLDFESVLWLENYLRSYHGTVLCISHDRTFLRNISDKVFWLDRGRVRVCPKGYGYFETWSQMLIDQEKRELDNRQKILDLEEDWGSRSAPARRKRNERRLEQMKIEREKLKADKSLFRQTMQKLELEPISPSLSSKIIAEFIKVGKVFKDEAKTKVILDNFNLRIIRGDKIGILGKNGAGKTTFLKMLIKELEPDCGKVKLSKNIDISYFDQNRSNLRTDETIQENLCPGGGEYINVTGKPRHVCGYLKDFMFDPQMAQDPAGTLSGGQKNRLMLAKVLANPGNCLILDEPTNDLDMDTLDMLEEILANFKGTTFVVSHDRDFLDKTVNKIIFFKGDGEVEYHIGGYSDYEAEMKSKKEKSVNKNNRVNQRLESKSGEKSARLTYKLQYELDNLPKKIDNLTKELKILNEKFSNPDFFSSENKDRDKLLERSKVVTKEIEDSENRWLELEEMRNSIEVK